METWKAMLGASIVLVVFAVVVSVANVTLTGPTLVGLLVLAAVVSTVFYVLSSRGYRMGRQIGENMRDEE